MHRFFVDPSVLIGKEVHIPVDISQQVTRVLHLKPGELIILLDHLGNEFQAELIEVNDRDSVARITAKSPAGGEPVTKVTMMVCLTQREKFEMILQKCTEIGVSTFLPVTSSRSLVQRPSDVIDKYPRWNKIIKEAAEQSERGKTPVLLPPMKLTEALKSHISPAILQIVFWESEEKTSIKQILRIAKVKEVIALIGPEGGLTEEEVKAAINGGFVSVSLGKRILRMETAAMIAAELVIYELG